MGNYLCVCAMCGKPINEGYNLFPQTEEELNVLEEKFGDEISNWVFGECCFGGYCGANPGLDADTFFENVIKPFVRENSKITK